MKKLRLILLLVTVLCLYSGAVGAVPVAAQMTVDQPSDRMVIVVTATRIPQVLEEVPVSVEVIDREDIERMGANTLTDALRLAAGIVVNNKGGRGADQTAFIRGSTSPQVLILVDGAPVASPQGAFTLHHIPAGIIERIEIVKGPGSALYGADAVGGVINVITQSPVSAPDGTRVTVKTDLRDVEFLATATGTVGDANFGLTAGYVDSKGFRSNTDYQENHLRLRFDREFSPVSEGYIQFSWLAGQGGAPDPVGTMFPANGRQRDVHARTEFVYSKDFSNGQINSMLYGRRYERDYSSSFEDGNHRTVTIGGEFQRDFDVNNGQVTIGIAARTDHANSSGLDGEKKSESSAALFGQWVTELSENVSLTTGVRIDSHSAYKAPISPRVGIRIGTGPDTVLRASIGRAFRAPTFDDLYWKPSMWDEGNPNLKPEDGWSYELGVKHGLSWATIDMAVFQRSLKNWIRWAEGDDDIWRPYNVAESRTRGVEVEMSVSLSNSVELGTHWTLLDAKNVQTGEKIPWVPGLEGAVTAQYVGRDGSLTAFGSVRYRGERPTGGSEKMPAYWVLDGRVSRALDSQTEVFVEAGNLLDQRYEEAEGYPMPGRTIFLGALHRF